MRCRCHTFVSIALAVLGLASAVRSRGEVLTFDVPQPVVISESGTPEVTLNVLAPAIASINSVIITIEHDWLGDLSAKLVSSEGLELRLFDRPGISDEQPQGSSAVLGDFISNGDPENPSFILVAKPYQFAAQGVDFEAAAADAVVNQLLSVVPTANVYAGKNWLPGPFAAGAWQLVVTDSADLSGGQITAVEIDYGTTSQSAGISWNPPADIVYGTALGPTQLNASVTSNGNPVPGTFTYSPAAGSVLSAGNGQTLSVTFIPQDPGTSSTLTASVPINVQPAPLLITADDKGMSYGGPLPILTASYRGFVNGDTESALTQPITLMTSATADSDFGSYPIFLTGGASANYSLTLQNGTLRVGQAVLTINADSKTKVYGDSLPALTVTYSGFIDGDTPASLGLSPVIQTPATSASPVGTYPITVTIGPVPNYVLALNAGTLTVTKAFLDVTAQDTNAVYGGILPGFTASYSGLVNGDTGAALTQPITFSTTAHMGSPVGSYPITVSGGISANYLLIPHDGTLTITKAALTIKVDDKSKVYGAPLPTFTATYTGFVNGDTAASLSTPISFATTADTMSPVGPYPILVNGGGNPNYSIVVNYGTLTVNKATLSATADDKITTYGAPLPLFTVTYSGFVNGDTASSLSDPVRVVTSATASSAAGTYPLTLTGGTNANYAISPHSGTLTIQTAPLVVTADNKTKIYGSPLPQFTATYSGFINGDTKAVLTQPISFATTAAMGSPVGLYSIVISGGASPNYTIVPQNGTLTVMRAPLSITADNKTKVYGSPLPSFTATVNGFVNGDTVSTLATPITFATTALSASPVGNYPITVTGGGFNPNYDMTLNPGVLTVAKATLTVTADDQTKVYGSPLPTLTASYTGFINGDTLSAVTQPASLGTAATAGSPVGSYPITISGGSSSNYSLVLKPGTLSVSKAPLVIGAKDTTKVYGAPLPTIVATYAGFVNGDTASSLVSPVSLVTTATSSSPVGVYPISVGTGPHPNYNISTKEGTLTVTPAPLQVKADDKIKVYGAALPNFSASFSGFVNGDNATNAAPAVSFATSATPRSDVGSYPITVTAGASPNYSVQSSPGVLTIAKARLTAAADSKTKVYGAPAGPLTMTYNGFLNGDTAADLTEAVSLSTTANANSPVGSYPITATGGASRNYLLVLKNGSFDVTQAPLTIKVDDKTKPVGAPLPALTVTYSGFVNGDTVDSLNQPVHLATSATVSSGPGKYPIIANGADSANYAITFLSGTLTVTTADAAPSLDAKTFRLGLNGVVSMAVDAPVGSNIRIEWTEDLENWYPVYTGTATGGSVQFNAGNRGELPIGFFRVVLLP